MSVVKKVEEAQGTLAELINEVEDAQQLSLYAEANLTAVDSLRELAMQAVDPEIRLQAAKTLFEAFWCDRLNGPWIVGPEEEMAYIDLTYGLDEAD